MLSKVDFIIVHGGKFELKWFERYGIDISKILIYDTLLSEYCIAGNRDWPLDLDSVSIKYNGYGKDTYVSRLIEIGICPSEIPPQLLSRYCKQDVYCTANVFLKQRRIIFSEGLEKVLYIRCLTTALISDVELHGIYLDKELVQTIYEESIKEHREVLAQLDAMTGGINMASPQQVAKFIYEDLGFEELKDRKTGRPIRGKSNKAFPNGAPKTDEDTLVQLKARTKEQRNFLRLRKEESKLRKKITSYCQRFMHACGIPFTPLKEKKAKAYSSVPGSCLLNGKLNQSIAQTHRLTSTDPNLQNIDRKIKKVITARNPGWKIMSADYRQLEFRAAACVAQDKQAYEDITNDVDIHSFTARVLTDAGQFTERQEAKAHTFKPLYFGNSGTKAEKAYYKAFREKYKEIYQTQRGWIDHVLKYGYLRTVTGLMFYWKGTEITQSGYIINQSSIANYPVQMFATADIAPIGTVLLWHELRSRKLKSFIVNAVHDSVVLEVAPDEIEIVGNLLEKCLSKDIVPFFKRLINFDINYPMEIEVDCKSNWGYEKEKG